MITFETGKTYQCRSICDHNCVWTYTVVKRTAKTVTISEDGGKPESKRISVWNDVEQVFPQGKFSMCPVLSADKVV